MYMCYMCVREGDGSWWSITMFLSVHQSIDIFTHWFIPSFIHPEYFQFSSISLKTAHKSELSLNVVDSLIMGFHWNYLGFVEYSLIFCCLILEVTTVGINSLISIDDICHHRILTKLVQVMLCCLMAPNHYQMLTYSQSGPKFSLNFVSKYIIIHSTKCTKKCCLQKLATL